MHFLMASMLLPVLAAVFTISAGAQDFPIKPVRIVVPFPPGGVDVTIRQMQKIMSDDLGQAVLIDNRPGANGFIGSEQVARSVPDGYTILATSSSTMISGVLVSTKVPFDVIKDFTPVTMLNMTVSTLIAKPGVPFGTVKELIDYAKRNPGKVAYASTGIGSAQHLDGEYFKVTAGVDLNHIPYKGFGPVVQAVAAGEVDVAFMTVAAANPLLQGGKARPLAHYNGPRPTSLPPNTPEMTATVPQFRATPGWIGLLGPAALPRAVLMRLNGAAVKSLTPEMRAKMAEIGTTLIGDSPEEFSAKIKAGLESTAGVVRQLKAIGVKFED
ncbi:MAG: tripartite tricarboxylate transporter substrate binding protein [Betaproteobacteria bacterium]|nr:tripartite tricarboxylate transporter substrate binding protein [Betaproteobacteria bacterium]